MFAVSRRRRFAFAAGLLCAALAPAAAGQIAPADPAGVGSPVASGGRVGAGEPGEANPSIDEPRDRKRAVTEGAWYLFLVTAGALAALMAVIWLFGFYKRQFLADETLDGELFDAQTRAEIERHRKEVQAEAARARAEPDGDGAVGEEAADADATPPNAADATPRADLAAQTAPAPDPAVQPKPGSGLDDRPPA